MDMLSTLSITNHVNLLITNNVNLLLCFVQEREDVTICVRFSIARAFGCQYDARVRPAEAVVTPYDASSSGWSFPRFPVKIKDLS